MSAILSRDRLVTQSMVDRLLSSSDQSSSGVGYPFLINGLKNPEDLSRSSQVATIKTHLCIILVNRYFDTRDEQNSDDVDEFEPFRARCSVPPSSPEGSQYLQEAIHDSYRSLKAKLDSVPVNERLTASQDEHPIGCVTPEVEESVVQSLGGLTDSIVEDPSTVKRQNPQLLIHWKPVADAVLNEALGSLAQNHHVNSLCSLLTEALNLGFSVRPPTHETEEWELLDADECARLSIMEL
ncbi:hypothetical protein M408DRAFT_90972 [Serendipita vermifera MAFF 305830]|uniref:Uncharacterized protein n=1 Tax=Serendipita vermifera MAFF 305830 TaxID=933852 RepID=A0A0C3BBE1_SERVB|nr:hypothetical protein M408DRAFT_90972 [Serendipita vermifera MAFF 305830]